MLGAAVANRAVAVTLATVMGLTTAAAVPDADETVAARAVRGSRATCADGRGRRRAKAQPAAEYRQLMAAAERRRRSSEQWFVHTSSQRTDVTTCTFTDISSQNCYLFERSECNDSKRLTTLFYFQQDL